jgi:hypothetical protein
MHNPENTNTCELVPEEAHSCILLSSQQYGLGLVNLRNLEFWHFKTFRVNDESVGDRQLN